MGHERAGEAALMAAMRNSLFTAYRLPTGLVFAGA